MLRGFNNNQVGGLPGRPTVFGGSSRPQGTPVAIKSPWGGEATIYCKAGKYYTDPQCTDQLEGKNLKEATESYWNRQTSGTPTTMDTSVSTPQSNSVPTPYVTNTPDSGKQPTVSGPVGTLDAKSFALTPDDYEDFSDSDLLRGLTGSAQPTTTYNIDDLKDPAVLSHIEQKIQATAEAAFRAADDLLNSLSDEFSRRKPEHRAEQTVQTDYGVLTLNAYKDRDGRKLAFVDYQNSSYSTAESLRQKIYDNIIMR